MEFVLFEFSLGCRSKWVIPLMLQQEFTTTWNLAENSVAGLAWGFTKNCLDHARADIFTVVTKRIPSSGMLRWVAL
jgi:hypothetical protein